MPKFACTPDRTVLVVDDDDAVRDSIEMVLSVAGYKVSGYASGIEFLDASPYPAPCCALLDLRMPGMDGLSVARELRRKGSWMPIAFLSGEPDIPSTVDAIKLGATDFLVKPVRADRLMGVVGQMLEQSQQLHVVHEHDAATRKLLESLTDREREVLDGMLHGLQNKQIARVLGISHRTVEIHRSRVMQKTHASNLLELARLLEPAMREPATKSVDTDTGVGGFYPSRLARRS